MFKMIKNKLLKKYDFYLKNVMPSTKFFVNKNLDDESLNLKDIKHSDKLFNISQEIEKNYNNVNTVYYISDLHLDYKILKKFPKKTTKEKIKKYIKSLVLNMVNDLNERLYLSDYLLIAGDVSLNIEISRIFYEELISYDFVKSENIIVVLGNNELRQEKNIEIALEKYKELFRELKITFLENELLYIKGKGLGGSIHKLTEDEINKYSIEEIQKMCIDSKFTILGGIGFSGLNRKLNASNGLYGNAIKTLEEDKKLSCRFKKIYLKIKQAIGDKEIIILTHNPKKNWSNDKYINKWIYVSGHTHKNEYFQDNDKVVFADNQIGNINDKFNLKHFIITRKYDIFKYYVDGIYEIDKFDYMEFVYGMGIKIEYNSEDLNIIMIKKSGVYLFLLKDNENIYLLDGDKKCKLNIIEVDYYYKNIDIYLDKIKEQNDYIISDNIIKVWNENLLTNKK